MHTVQSFLNLFDYDRWANEAALASLAGVGAAERPRGIFAHILGAQRVWRARFDHPRPPGAQPWPGLTADECRTAIEENSQAWKTLVSRLTEEKLGENLVYHNTQGARFETPIRDVLTHLLMHSAYHRGQVAAAVREAGGNPANTDYVYYLRQKA